MAGPTEARRPSLRVELTKRSSTPSVPGMSVQDHFWLLLPALLVPIFLPVGATVQMLALGVVAGCIVLIGPLSMLWVRTFGPPIANEALRLERIRNRRILLYVAAGSLSILIAVFVLTDNPPELVLAVVLLVEMAIFAWVRPAMAVVPILLGAALVGSTVLLVAAPLTVMLARRDQRLRLRLPRSVRRTALTVSAAALAFLLTLPFANTSAGSAPQQSMAQTAPSSPTKDGTLLGRVVQWLRGGDSGVSADYSVPSRPVTVPGSAPEPPDEPTQWWLWALVGLAGAAVAIGLWWFHRRRKSPGLGPAEAVADQLARLESIGRSVGRPRKSTEGAITFAHELRVHTGDERLPPAGALVSGALYGSGSTSSHDADRHLEQVEADPPPAPPTPSRPERVRRRAAAMSLTPRTVIVGGLALLVVGAAGWAVVPRLGDLRNPQDRELAYVKHDDAPPVWDDLLDTPAADLLGWQLCAGTPTRPQQVRMQAGVERLSEPLGAIRYHWEQPGATSWSRVRAGTDDMSAMVLLPEAVSRPGADASESDPWRITRTPLRPLGAFSTVDDVLRETAVRDPIRTEFVDRNGDRFTRYESLPPLWDDVYRSSQANSAIQVDPLRMMVVDIWVDRQARPTRVRMIEDGPDGEWSEWRRVAHVDSAEAALAMPECERRQPYANADWIGFEPWEPTRPAPLLVGFDDDDNPFDAFGWEGGPPTTEDGGAIAGPIPTLSVGDLYSMWPDGGGAAVSSFDVDWQHGAAISVVRDDEGYPVATRLDRAGATAQERSRVVRWESFAPFEMYESLLIAIVGDGFPMVDHARLDALVEPLWDGRNYVSADLDADGADELTLMTQSTATVIVAGRDDSGRVVSIVVLDDWFQWRRLGFEGTPPPSVLAREAELAECIAGDRGVDHSGRCLGDTD